MEHQGADAHAWGCSSRPEAACVGLAMETSGCCDCSSGGGAFRCLADRRKTREGARGLPAAGRGCRRLQWQRSSLGVHARAHSIIHGRPRQQRPAHSTLCPFPLSLPLTCRARVSAISSPILPCLAGDGALAIGGSRTCQTTGPGKEGIQIPPHHAPFLLPHPAHL